MAHPAPPCIAQDHNSDVRSAPPTEEFRYDPQHIPPPADGADSRESLLEANGPADFDNTRSWFRWFATLAQRDGLEVRTTVIRSLDESSHALPDFATPFQCVNGSEIVDGRSIGSYFDFRNFRQVRRDQQVGEIDGRVKICWDFQVGACCELPYGVFRCGKFHACVNCLGPHGLNICLHADRLWQQTVDRTAEHSRDKSVKDAGHRAAAAEERAQGLR